jgi:hypothetical protein
MAERFVEYIRSVVVGAGPGARRRPASVCTICGALVAPDYQNQHLLVCPVVHPEKGKDK